MFKATVLWDDINMENQTIPTMKRNYFLRIDGVAATFLRTKRECLKMAAFGHEDRPDAIVELVEFDVATNTDTVITRLYN